MFDTFISYRRVGGSYFAARVYDFLTFRNFKPFYDKTEMESGRFDEQIRNNLNKVTNFILLLTKGALDRCIATDDWVRIEIELAIANNLNIIVLQEDNFVYPDNLPESLFNLRNYQA